MNYIFRIMLLLTLSVLVSTSYAVDSTVIKPIIKSTTTGYPVYNYTINYNTNGWSCDNCNAEQATYLIPAPSLPGGNAPSSLPAGTYSVVCTVTIKNGNGTGRWININNLRVFESQTQPYTLAQTGNLGTQSCDGSGCANWSGTWAMSAVVNIPDGWIPQFGFDVGDSSHNETSYYLTGNVTITPMY